MFLTSPVIGQQFAFAHGRAGVLQQFLLNQSDIDRLLGTHDRHETEQVLTELRFTKLIDQSLRDPDAILAACQAWVRSEVASMTPEDMQPVFGILWMDGDLPVLAYLLKRSKGFTSDISNLPASHYSAYAPEELRRLVENDDDVGLPEHLTAFVRRMNSTNMEDPRLIDAAVAQYAADTKLMLARKSGSNAIRTYVRHGIDFQNIRTVLRFQEEDRTSALPHLATGGTIVPSDLAASNATVAARARMAGFHALADVIDKHPGDLNRLERTLNDILAQDVSIMWNVILRIEPLFAFAATALAQIRLIRAIVIGKRNKLSPQQIKQMLPPFLSASHYML